METITVEVKNNQVYVANNPTDHELLIINHDELVGTTLGEKIRIIRLSLGKNVDEFAQLLGASKGLVSKWENNQHDPSKERLQKIADLGNVPIEELVEGKLQSNVIKGRASVLPLDKLLLSESQLSFDSKVLSEKKKLQIMEIVKILSID